LLCAILAARCVGGEEGRAKLEPADGRVLHGWGQHTILYEKEALPYIEACGQDCAVVSVYLDLALVDGASDELVQYVKEKEPAFLEEFGDDTEKIRGVLEEYFPSPARFAAFRKRTGKEYIPLMAVMWHRTNDKNIAEGKHDREIESLAEQVKSCGFPVFLRPGSECGPFGYNDKIGQTSREHYAEMFRRFVRIFREKEVDNAAFVWCTVGVESYDYWMEYYAGDEFVDWWGINYFSRRQITGSKRFLEEAKKRKKPVMICESAPAFEGGTVSKNSIERFFKPYFDVFDEHANVKAFVYINLDCPFPPTSPG